MVRSHIAHRSPSTAALSGYRGPLVAGLVLAAGLGGWTILELNTIEQRHRVELQRFVDGVLLALDASHDLLRPPMGPHRSGARRPGGGPRPPEGAGAGGPNDLGQLQPVLQRMVQGRHRIRWIGILSEDQLVAAAGSLDSAPQIHGSRGSREEQGLLISWRPLGAPVNRPQLPGTSTGREAGEDPEPGTIRRRPISTREQPALLRGAPVAVIAMDARVPPDARHRDRMQLAQKIGVAAAGVIALLAAWVLGVRSRGLGHALEAEQVRRAHLEELSLAASGLAHETKNPLGIIRGLAQSLQRSGDLSTEQQVALDQILDESDRAASRLGEFMSYARVRTPELSPVNGSQLLQRAIDVLAVDLESAGVAAEVVAQPGHLLADREMLLQIVLNLLLNSLEASPAGSAIRLQLSAGERTAELTVTDQGRGIEPELLERVLRPYVTGRADGHGLGLAIVKRMVESHGWSIALHSTPGRGTTVTVRGIRTASSQETS